MSNARRGKLHQARACLSPSVTSTTWLDPRRARGVPIVHPPLIISPVPFGACVFPEATFEPRPCVGLAVLLPMRRQGQPHPAPRRTPRLSRPEPLAFHFVHDFVCEFRRRGPKCRRSQSENTECGALSSG
jgi:hypothetical protein